MRASVWMWLVCWLSAATVPTASGDFASNCPKVCECMWKGGKRTVGCDSGQLQALPKGLSDDVQVLDVSNANLQELAKDAFQLLGLEHLHKIVAKNAGIERLHKDAFRDVLGLKELDLSNNRITKLDAETFNGNPKLQRLLLSDNPLQTLVRYQFPPLPNIQMLQLSGCQLTSISAKAFNNLASLETLDLSRNRLAMLESDVLQTLTRLKSLRLSDNPWRCDCHLRLFRDWLMERNLYMEDASCAEPERLLGKSWNSVASDEFACRPQIHVPEPTVVARRGQNVTLRCQISGNPAPTANWVQNGRVLGNNTQIPFTEQQRRYVIHQEGTVNHWINLTIARVTEQDVGQYLCFGFNAGGVVERNVTLVFNAITATSGGGGGGERSSGWVPLDGALMVGLLVAAACLLLLLLVLAYCCCCRRCDRNSDKPGVAADAGSVHKHLNGSRSSTSNGNGSVMVIGAPGEKAACNAAGGGYQRLPQSDLEMELHRCPTALREPSTSVMCNPTCAAADDDCGLSRRLSLPSVANGRVHGDYPDLLHVQRSPESSPLLMSTPAARLAPLDTRRAFSTPRGAVQHQRPGYVTLPRRPRTPSWGSPAAAALRGPDPVYDSLGPRTTVDGSSRLSLNSPAPDHQQQLPAYYVPLEATPPPPAAFSTLPRNSRLPSLTALPFVSGRPRSLSTDIIEPLHELPEETDDPPQVTLTNGNHNGSSSRHTPTPPPAQAKSQPPPAKAAKIRPVPPPKPNKKPVPPPVLPKPRQRPDGSFVTSPLLQGQGEDGTEV